LENKFEAQVTGMYRRYTGVIIMLCNKKYCTKYSYSIFSIP